MGVPLVAAGKAGTDESNQIPAFHVRDRHHAAVVGLSETNRCSPIEWSRSGIVIECGSAKAVAASGNPTGSFEGSGSLLRIPAELETHPEIYGSKALRASA